MPNNSFPWVNPWREEIAALLEQIPSRRKPALRRSLREDFLFAADLPSCSEEASWLLFLALARERGWEATEAGGWILLRRKDASPPPGWFPEEAKGEAACLRELLRRHPGSDDPAQEMLMLLKAREEGEAAWERTCRELHREFARRLRMKVPLPRIPLE